MMMLSDLARGQQLAEWHSQEFSLFPKMKSVSPIICKFNLVAATDAPPLDPHVLWLACLPACSLFCFQFYRK